jgi:hypothetical protein
LRVRRVRVLPEAEATAARVMRTSRCHVVDSQVLSLSVLTFAGLRIRDLTPPNNASLPMSGLPVDNMSNGSQERAKALMSTTTAAASKGGLHQLSSKIKHDHT